jgi:DNA-binding IclR family transcriptional regulator
MASMTTETALLRALLKLSRRRAHQGAATLADLVERVGSDASEVQRALASLARSQLVQRSGESARLSLAGLAVAVAVAANARRAKTVARPSRPARVVSMVRRRRAA